VLQSDRIAQTEPLLASRLLDEAERLAGNPTLLSTRGGVPFLPQQRYSFWFDPEEKHKFTSICSSNTARMNSRSGSPESEWCDIDIFIA
jgi:hypothetical protein